MNLTGLIGSVVYVFIYIFLYLDYNFFIAQVGSEDALSSVDDLNVTEQLSMKAHTLDQVTFNLF